jgi:replication-associated recombination protein RarA
MNDKDPWTLVTTRSGFPADQVISALQKEVRRGNTENAVLLAYEMVSTSPELEAYLWYRLKVISVEDVGFGEPMAPVLLDALSRMAVGFSGIAGEKVLFALHAVRYLCECRKDRSSDEMAIWVKRAVASGEARPEIPDYALDMHTAAGQAMGRSYRHFLEEGAQIHPEMEERDRTYLERVMGLLDEGKL